jgi:tetratricopeptide (TPR) repeat protein
MALKSTLKTADRKTRIFISYSRKDIEFANLLSSQLQESGYQAMLDKTDIAPGEPWQERLINLIKEADVVIFSVSPHSAASTVCQWEVNESAKLGKRILPVVLDPVDTGTLPEALTKLNFIFFTDQSFDDAFAKLKSALDTDLLWVRQHTRIGELALEWQANKKSSSRLLGSAALAQAENWIARHPEGVSQPTDLQRQYIAASRRGVNVFQRLMLSGALVTAFIAMGLMIWGYVNKLEADDQRAAAEAERSKIQKTLDAVTIDTEDLALTLSQKFKGASGISPKIRIEVLEDALKIQQHLLDSAGSTTGLLLAKSETLNELSDAMRDNGDAQTALSKATESTLIMENLVKNDDANEALKRNLSVGYNVRGAAQLELGNYEAALKSYELDLGIAQNLLNLLPADFSRKDDLAISEQQVGIVNYNLDHLAEARVHQQKAKDLLDELIKLQPTEDKFQLKLAKVYGFLAQIDEVEKNFESATKNFEKKFEILNALQAKHADDLDLKSELSLVHQRLGQVYASAGDKPTGLNHLLLALENAQKLADENPENLELRNELSVSNNLLGNFYFDDKNLIEARKYYAADLKISHELADADAKNSEYQIGLAKSMLNAAHAEMDVRENLTSALTIMNELSKENDLKPADANFKNTLETEFAALPKQ